MLCSCKKRELLNLHGEEAFTLNYLLTRWEIQTLHLPDAESSSVLTFQDVHKWHKHLQWSYSNIYYGIVVYVL
jgi:hypothetical protein